MFANNGVLHAKQTNIYIILRVLMHRKQIMNSIYKHDNVVISFI